jgi:23S rRNA pseudouridine2605 synthase
MEERLQKIIAAAGIAARRKAEEMILQGRVTVNGHMVSKLGSKADLSRDKVQVDGIMLHPPRHHLYVLLNKPTGYVSTVSDPEQRPTVMSLVKQFKERLYPVGRLDFHSSGLLLLTNDGALANHLMSRESEVPRTYQVKLEGNPSPEALDRLRQGITLDGRKTAPCEVRKVFEREKPWYEITLVEGRYHQVRRMFERIGHPVVKLRRIRIAFLTDDRLPLGRFRLLSPREVERLKTWKGEAR